MLRRLLPVLATAVLLLPSQSLLVDAAVYKASYPTPIYGVTNATEEAYRQRVCDRYTVVESGNRELKDALQGMELRPIITVGDFFRYTEEDGINEADPGLVVQIFDILANRSGFTWRNSFAVSYGPSPNATWTDILQLYTEMYDITLDFWGKDGSRLNRGIAFLDQWFDGNMILIEKIKPSQDKNSINYTNYLEPFEPLVWYVTIATVIFSALVFQFLEYLHNERDDRSIGQWFQDNLYLSSINFTQQYAYEPVSPAGRLFGFSMAFWTMVMGATYTANLASFFVEVRSQPVKLQDIDDAIRRQLPICTWRGTQTDLYIAKRYPQAIRVPMNTEKETYDGLHTGVCGVTVGAKATWLGHEMDKDYNPNCDLEWVGRTVEEISSSFAVKADPAVKCTNLIRDVLNYHLNEMSSQGILDDLWEEYYNSNPNKNDCGVNSNADDGDTEEVRGRRLQTFTDTTTTSLHDGTNQIARLLKGGGGGGGANPAAAASSLEGDDAESSSLSMEAMAGTFVLHAACSAAAILVGLYSAYRAKQRKREPLQVADKETTSLSSVSNSGQVEDKPIDSRRVAGLSLASGSCANGSPDIIKHGNVQEQLQALYATQKQLQKQQETLSQQMSLVVSILTKQE